MKIFSRQFFSGYSMPSLEHLIMLVILGVCALVCVALIWQWMFIW